MLPMASAQQINEPSPLLDLDQEDTFAHAIFLVRPTTVLARLTRTGLIVCVVEHLAAACGSTQQPGSSRP